MNCPICGRPMKHFDRLGVRRDGSDVPGWRCRCWHTIYEGELPWALTLSSAQWMQYLSDFGAGPSAWMNPPVDWLNAHLGYQTQQRLQLRLF